MGEGSVRFPGIGNWRRGIRGHLETLFLMIMPGLSGLTISASLLAQAATVWRICQRHTWNLRREYVVGLVRETKGRVQQARGASRKPTGVRFSEMLESRTYLSTAIPQQMVFVSQVPIIVDPGSVILSKPPGWPSGPPPAIYIQLQTSTGQVPPLSNVPSNELTVTLTLTNATVTNPVFSDGLNTETASVTANTYPTSAIFSAFQITTVGQYTLTASDPAGLQASTSVEVTKPSPSNTVIIVPQQAAVIGTLDNLYMEPEDAFGNPFTVPLPKSTFSVVTGSGTSRGTFGAFTPNLFPYGTVETGFYGTAAGTPVQIDGTVDGMPLTSTLPTIEVNPGVASPTKSIVSVSQASVEAGNTDTIDFQAKDANGNSLTSGGRPLRFKHFPGRD